MSLWLRGWDCIASNVFPAPPSTDCANSRADIPVEGEARYILGVWSREASVCIQIPCPVLLWLYNSVETLGWPNQRIDKHPYRFMHDILVCFVPYHCILWNGQNSSGCGNIYIRSKTFHWNILLLWWYHTFETLNGHSRAQRDVYVQICISLKPFLNLNYHNSKYHRRVFCGCIVILLRHWMAIVEHRELYTQTCIWLKPFLNLNYHNSKYHRRVFCGCIVILWRPAWSK